MVISANALIETMSPTRRAFLLGSGAIGAGLLAPGIIGGIARAATPGTVTYALSAYPPNLRAFEHSGAASRTIKMLLFRGLLSFNDKGAIQPELAESWELSDARTYLFKLRTNATFQNGQPVRAEDVKASFEAIRGEKSTAYLRQAFQEIETIDAVDAKTVRIILKRPTPSFAAVLAGPHAAVVFGKQMDKPDALIGAGPYRLESSEKGVSLTFKARTDFYKPGLPRTETLRFVVYADDSLRVAALEAGDVDIIEYVPAQSMKSLSEKPGVSMQSALGLYMYLVFNLKQGPFTDPRIRQAVSYAINRDDLVQGAFLGFGKALDGVPIPDGSEFKSKELEHLWPYDPDKARSLLKEAGAENLQATFLATSTYSFHKDPAEIIQQQLAAVGMNIKLSLPEWGVRVNQGNEGRYHFAINGGANELGDPDELTALFGSGSNSYRRSFGLADPKLDDLLLRGRHEVNPAKRLEIYTELQRAVQEIAPVTFLNYRTQAFALRDGVKDFKTLPDFLINQSGIAFDEVYIG
ncbi:ABC-type transport system substrate-binding protein [Agrobacterium larrymoorei]|uniref:ABC-type transport system substrate-binding protein n=1 Tax=Agrobacterium larrymoorei TaxID=160699 RepID=A0AAJ2BDI7_9HYPH|nr:ABC transporter substrate-binding protein [Agrobacterium larrymoorei]MDR6101868.1 ABC-type transport system substrate-binding protein [Agrobacterium larrymoorei]